jgi:EPS-associated MarR family transcriptional regulator
LIELCDTEHGLELMRLIEKHPGLSQRQLARAMGISLGKTHYLLHALLDKGLVKAGNFRRSDHKRAYAYMLTPSGLREKMKLARAFLVRKEAEFEELRSAIAALRDEIQLEESPGSASSTPPVPSTPGQR